MNLESFATKAEALRYIMDTVPECRTKAQAEKFLRAKLPRKNFFQAKIISAIKKQYPACFVWKQAAGPYSREGIPDVAAMIDDYFF